MTTKPRLFSYAEVLAFVRALARQDQLDDLVTAMRHLRAEADAEPPQLANGEYAAIADWHVREQERIEQEYERG